MIAEVSRVTLQLWNEGRLGVSPLLQAVTPPSDVSLSTFHWPPPGSAHQASFYRPSVSGFFTTLIDKDVILRIQVHRGRAIYNKFVDTNMLWVVISLVLAAAAPVFHFLAIQFDLDVCWIHCLYISTPGQGQETSVSRCPRRSPSGTQ